LNAKVFEFCGCDVHKATIEVVWLDLSGQSVRNGTFENSPEGNKRFWAECERLNTKQVAMESTGIYWRGLHRSKPKIIQVHVFNSASIKLKTRPKTDVQDAMWIARCLRAGFIQPSSITLGRSNQIKSLCRLRVRIVEEITVFKNQIHTILDEFQRKLSPFTSGMNTQLALNAITVLSQQGSYANLKNQVRGKRLQNAVQKNEKSVKTFLSPILPAEAALTLELALRGLLDRSRACYEVEKNLSQIVQDPTIRKDLELLVSIPGISGVSALQLYVELGRIDRFTSKRQVVSWAGLCPRIKSSGGITTRGRITKQGNSHVRRLMFQVARASLRAKTNPLRPWYERLRRRKSGRVALVALARKMLVISYTLLKKKQIFHGTSLKQEVKVYSTAKKIVKGLTSEPIAPLLEVLSDWLDTPKKYRESISGLFHIMYATTRQARGTFS
jgi:transposase